MNSRPTAPPTFRPFSPRPRVPLPVPLRCGRISVATATPFPLPLVVGVLMKCIVARHFPCLLAGFIGIGCCRECQAQPQGGSSHGDRPPMALLPQGLPTPQRLSACRRSGGPGNRPRRQRREDGCKSDRLPPPRHPLPQANYMPSGFDFPRHPNRLGADAPAREDRADRTGGAPSTPR